MRDVFTVSSTALPSETRVAGFRGVEGISRPYEFELYLLMGEEGLDFDLAGAVGARATLSMDRGDGRPPFVFHGILSTFALLHELDGGSLFRATLVPALWRLTQTRHSRVFTDQSVPDIIKQVLEDGGLSSDEYAFALSRSYPPEAHVCQYQESHLDFVSRWMEREGIYYYFEQGEGAEKLILTDDKSFQGALRPDPVRFFPLAGHDVTSGEAIHALTCKHRALPASVRLADHDYLKPTLDVSGSAAVSSAGLGEISVHGARFFSPDDGARLAGLRAGALLAQQVVFHGSGTARYLRPGYLFALSGHPRAGFDASYLVTELEHHANQAASTAELRKLTGLDGDDVYRIAFTAIPEAVQFRAEGRTPWPRIYGFEGGTICGPKESEYAQIDEHGRYNVKFKFDESALGGGKASTWVRMLQPHGGSTEGFHFPLRKGTEVLFTFLGGDPDRPVIAGVVPNLHTPSPVTKQNHTTNVIHTGGGNHFELEDSAGAQRVTLSTPHTNTMVRMGAPNDNHNLILTTDGEGLLHTGGNLDVTVVGTKFESVGHKVIEQYTGPFTTTVTKDVVEQCLANKSEDVCGDHAHISANASVSTGAYTLNASKTISGTAPEYIVLISKDGQSNASSTITLTPQSVDLYSADGQGNASTISVTPQSIDIYSTGKITIEGAIVDVKGTPIKLNSP
jgi:type VI secretion system secreted protein VgrG